ncbi:fungal-specific transcription factor domain-containing protein [Mycena albidolilacea]|uniref:Fungal-specific transcription factor domain-containing protein n=1 Tax=Mycena albidolilacea TaxID=1033008 RepID=A0AAD7AQD9_9AGAR|nr:fungal-specific transcription factor domain-containing protein [Mycena albidolilacea]
MSANQPVDRNAGKRKRQRACDRCRRKKRRCDGGEICDHCVKVNLVCTYVEPATARYLGHIDNPSEFLDESVTAYVESLTVQFETAQTSLKRLEARRADPPLYARAVRNLVTPFTPPHPDDSGFIDLADSFGALSLDGAPPDPGFQGNSSAAMLVKAAVDVKTGGHLESHRRHRMPPAPRPWVMKSWEAYAPTPPHNFAFPDDHLMGSLVSLYFSNVNTFVPMLQRPMFEECLQRGVHMHDTGFGTILLLVCALGSLYLTDTGISKRDREILAWKWYNQIELCGHLLRRQPTLRDIQAYCLAAHFLTCISNPRFAWAIVGFGIRLAQDVGSHRRKAREPTITAYEELEKRAFWTLFFFDVQLSGALGRAAVLDPVDMTLTLPCDCDDEFWQLSPAGPGSQPPGTTPVTAFFISLINLYRIVHFTLRSLYPVQKLDFQSRLLRVLSAVAAELDTALNQWFSNLPPHLIWDPDRPVSLFFDQSAALHCFYYYTRILIHRAFIPELYAITPPNPLALDICTEAARECIQVADVHRRRQPNGNPLPFSQSPIFTAAMMLIIAERIHAAHPESSDTTDDLALIYTSISILRAQQERWPSSEYFITVLEGLISSDDDSLPDIHDLGPATHPDTGTHTTAMCEPAERVAIPIFPAFVGDEEILPGRVRRPLAI